VWKTYWERTAMLEAMTQDGVRAEKARENRLRRLARRQDLRLEKSRTRNPDAPSYGRYSLVDGRPLDGSNWRVRQDVCGGEYGATLDEIEAWLGGPEAKRRA
jgi:hypothetical protein